MLCNNLNMLELDPNDPQELSFALLMAVRRSGLSLSEISARLKKDYEVLSFPQFIQPALDEFDFISGTHFLK